MAQTLEKAFILHTFGVQVLFGLYGVVEGFLLQGVLEGF